MADRRPPKDTDNLLVRWVRVAFRFEKKGAQEKLQLSGSEDNPPVITPLHNQVKEILDINRAPIGDPDKPREEEKGPEKPEPDRPASHSPKKK